jgi:hypothetical protein
MRATYLTTDSITEGVGSSQILPLVLRLADAGLQMNLITFEKIDRDHEVSELLFHRGIKWTSLKFNHNGIIGGVNRLFELSKAVGETDLIHARSDVPAVAGLLSRQAPVLWDVRSLWTDQKVFMETSHVKKQTLKIGQTLESFSSNFSTGMSTLTHSIVPVLQNRHFRIPSIRTVVPTSVDLSRFKFSELMPEKIKCLFSGTYNNYYDLQGSAEFLKALRSLVPIEVSWARPYESSRSNLEVGEDYVFRVTQNEMALTIPKHSFGMAICKSNAGDTLKAAMPTKIAEFLACGRPVVVSKGIGDLDEFLSEFKAGIVVDVENDDLIEKAGELIHMLSDPETPNQCRSLAERYFDIDKGLLQYLDVYKSILKT